MRPRYYGHGYLQNERILRGWDHQSDVAGRITRGNCGPLSWSEVKNGRPTASVFRMICSGGTASSKSNDRTNPNRMAFALVIFPRVCPSVDMNMPEKNASDGDEKGSLNYSEAVADACMRASDERHQIAKHARDGFNGLGNSFPTFWSADRQVQLKPESNCTDVQNPGNNSYLNSSASSPHNDFSL